MVADRLASDLVPPRLTVSLKICSAFRKLGAAQAHVSLKICSAFRNLNAAAWPPTISNENVESASAHCVANRWPAAAPPED